MPFSLSLDKISRPQVCKIMTESRHGPQIDRLSLVNKITMAADGNICLDFKYDKSIAAMKNTSWDSADAEGGSEANSFSESSYRIELSFSHPVDISDV